MSKILPSEWEAPEHISLSEREFLVDRAETINGIIAASYLQVGQVLLQVKKKFKSDPELKGWFKRWCNETLPFSTSKAEALVAIAEQAASDPEILELSKTTSYTKLYRVLCLPGRARGDVIKLLRSGETMTQDQLDGLAAEPEVALEKAQSAVEEMEANLLRLELEIATLGGKAKASAQTQRSHQKTRLAKAMQQLQEKQAAVDSLEKTRSTQELVLLQLRKQLNQKQVFIENLTLDPDQNRQRDLARTVVDATRALDMLLASFDRYSTDKTELGAQAIETIERKMDEVKSKLLEHYGATTT